MQDIFPMLQWWIVLFGLGIIFLPLTLLIFNNFWDKGYAFSKVIGITFLSYIIYIFGISHILKFTSPTIYFFLWIFLLINIVILKKKRLFKEIKNKLPIFVFEEIIFLAALFFWSFVRMHSPDIHGLEKFMDFGFINSILRAEYFPPKDMWFPPFPINYYYYGHFITAFLTKLSNIPSNITYNLMLSTIFALTFISSFSIGVNLIKLISKFETRNSKQYQNSNGKNSKHFGYSIFKNLNLFRISIFDIRILFGGFLTAFLVSFAGNIHTIYTFFKPYNVENPVPFWNLQFSLSSFPNAYWYPNATRFIHNTIHEFPIYSFVVSDLHGHVLDIPIVLLTIAILLSLISKFEIRNPHLQSPERSNGGQAKQSQNSNGKNSKHFGYSIFKNLNLFRIWNLELRVFLLGFLLAVMYMTNVWDGIIYFLLTSIVLAYVMFRNSLNPEQIKNSLKIENCKLKIYQWFFQIFILGIVFIFFTLPFQLTFKPFVSGIGVLCAPDFLTNIGKFGPFLFEKDHCQHSPWWMLLILYGFFYFWTISFIFFILKKINSKFEIRNPHLQSPERSNGGQAKQSQNSNGRSVDSGQARMTSFWGAKRLQNLFRISIFDIRILNSSDLFVLILIFLSTFLIIIPEFIYAKDIYPAHYRANTMFKLVYQSFMMLSISSAYIILRIMPFVKNKIFTEKLIKKIPVLIYLVIAVFLFFLVSIYPNFAINSYYGDIFKNDKKLTLDGTVYLKNLYLTDYEAILWLNRNIKNQPIILEAQGDSYTDYARISANTGLPTVLGWTVHEWLWRGTYDIPAPRIPDVQTLYETEDLNIAKNLIKKYKIELVFVGDLERQKYPKMNDSKFKMLGSIVYQNGQTKIYKIDTH